MEGEGASSPTGGRAKRVKKIPAKLRDSYRESDASDGSGGLVYYTSEDDDGNGPSGFDVYNDDEDEASDEAGNLQKHKKGKGGFTRLGPKRVRAGSTTADTGKHEGANHGMKMVAWTSANAHSENEAGKSGSYYEWEETAKGFKRRKIGAQGWAVCLFLLYVFFLRQLTSYVFFSMASAATRGCGQCAKTVAAPSFVSISGGGRLARTAAVARFVSISGCGRCAKTAAVAPFVSISG
jgi:hypothetical protein